MTKPDKKEEKYSNPDRGLAVAAASEALWYKLQSV